MKLKDTFLSFIKGGITGISSLISGISPGAITVSLGIYLDIIDSIKTGFKKENRRIFLIIIPLFLGIIAGIFGGQKLVNYFLDNFKLQTIFLFVGLIAGGYRLTIRNISSKKRESKLKGILVFLITFIVLILIQILLLDKLSLNIDNNLINTLLFGILSGIVLLIPGLNITVNEILRTNYSILESNLLNIFNLSNVFSIILFITGGVLAVILICYLLHYILTKKEKIIKIIISASLTASIVIAILQVDKFTLDFVNIFTTILAFLWGYILAKNLENE